jgi:hypothetical protein
VKATCSTETSVDFQPTTGVISEKTTADPQDDRRQNVYLFILRTVLRHTLCCQPYGTELPLSSFQCHTGRCVKKPIRVAARSKA